MITRKTFTKRTKYDIIISRFYLFYYKRTIKMKFVLIIAVCLAILTSCKSAENIPVIKPVTDGQPPVALTETSPAATPAETKPTAADTTVTTPAETKPTAADTTVTTPAETASETSTLLLSANPVKKSYDKIGENGILVTERNGHLQALMPCWGTLEMCGKYAKSVNDFAGQLPDTKVYSMVIPTAIEFYLPSNRKGLSGSQKSRIDKVNETLDGVTAADVYSALELHQNEPIFSRTDHHWFPLGGYYAANAFLEQTNQPVIPSLYPNNAPLDENGLPVKLIAGYKTVTKKGYVGSMYNYSKDLNLKNDPEDFRMYVPEYITPAVYYSTSFTNPGKGNLFVSPDASAYYCSFLGADNLIAKITPNYKIPIDGVQPEELPKTEPFSEHRTLVIFKDSYGNALVPFLTEAYDTIYVCDIRYFDLNAVQFCKDVKADDVLFAVCTFTAAVSVVKNGFPVPAARITTLPASSNSTARHLL
jgi:hypothetical protein